MCNPIYNFYNCCCDHKGSHTTSSTTPQTVDSKALFPIKTAISDLFSDWETGDIKSATHYYQSNIYNNALEIFNNLEAFHFKYKIKELNVFKTNESGTTQETVEVSIIVMDMAGNLKRTISSQNINLVNMPFEQWIPIPLTTNVLDLNISPDEVVIKKVTISKKNTDSWRCNMFLSGLAEMI